VMVSLPTDGYPSRRLLGYNPAVHARPGGELESRNLLITSQSHALTTTLPSQVPTIPFEICTNDRNNSWTDSNSSFTVKLRILQAIVLWALLPILGYRCACQWSISHNRSMLGSVMTTTRRIIPCRISIHVAANTEHDERLRIDLGVMVSW